MELRECSKIIKFRDFQYRLNLGKIVTNVDLFEWKLKDSPKCELCQNNNETLIHIFYECNKVKPLIDYLYKTCRENGIDYNYSKEAFMLNFVHESQTHVINFMSIFIKQFIYKYNCKQQGSQVNVRKLIIELENHIDIEAAAAKRQHRYAQFKKKWGPVCNPI